MTSMRALVLLILLAAHCWAETAPATVPFSLAALRHSAEQVEQVRIPFRQIKELELFDRPVVTEGILEISRPLASVRWEFEGRAVVVLRNNVVRRWRTDGTREHVGNGPATQSLHGQMQALLTGDWEALDRLFVIAIKPDHDLIRLEPRSPDLARYVTVVEVIYRSDLRSPKSLTIKAPGGDSTIYQFEEPVDPGELAVARFEGP